jgi:hypothetical protein
MRKEPWDWPEEPRQRRRRPPPILEGEIIEPQSEPRIHRVTVEHRHVDRRRQGIGPQRVVIVVAFAILALILVRSPGALILLGAIIPHWVWVTLGVIVAALVIRRTVLRD